MKTLFSPELSGKEQLQQLLVLRLFYLIIEVIALASSQFYAGTNLPWLYLWLVMFLHAITVFGYYFTSRYQNEVSEAFVFQTILADILLFSGLFYFAGGASNGAVSSLLLPVATAAALFRWRWSLSLAIAAIGCYTLLMWFSYPVGFDDHSQHMHHGMSDNTNANTDFNTHLWAMWATFVFSCLLLVWFIGLQSAAVRRKQKSLASLRENQLRDEQLIAIATFAANAAHDLATPLSSISLLCDELKTEPGKAGVDTLIDQVNSCRNIVQSISRQAMENKDKKQSLLNVDEYFRGLVERWLVTRPDIVLNLNASKSLKPLKFSPDISLESAITNILDNAAQASLTNGANQLQLKIYTRDDQVFIEILDSGQGIDEQLIEVLGKEPVGSSENGLGLGQFLANSTIGRCGGSVWRETSKEGTQTLITLPLNGVSDLM